MIIIQLDSEQLSNLIQSAVRKGMSESPKAPIQPEPDQLLPSKQAAEFLNLSIFTIYGLVHQRKLVHYKQGKKLMFKRSELLQFIESGRKKTISEIELEAEKFLLNKKK